MKPDTAIITFKNNPAVQEAMQSMRPGEKGKCEVRYTLKSIGADSAEVIIEAWVPEGYEVSDQADEMNLPAGQTMEEEGGMTPAAMLVRKKSLSKKVAEAV